MPDPAVPEHLDTVTDPVYLRRAADQAAAAVDALAGKLARARRDHDAAQDTLRAAQDTARDLDEAATTAENNQPRVDGDPDGGRVDAHAEPATGNTED